MKKTTTAGASPIRHSTRAGIIAWLTVASAAVCATPLDAPYTPSRDGDAIGLEEAPTTTGPHVPRFEQLAKEHPARPDDRANTTTLAQANVDYGSSDSDAELPGRPLETSLDAGAADEPYQPRDEATVLEHLPAATRLNKLAPLRARVQAQPGQLKPALALARAYIQLSRVEADPRYLGYAEATLEPWPDGPASVTVLRATIAQSRHEFERALALLDGVLAADPDKIFQLCSSLRKDRLYEAC